VSKSNRIAVTLVRSLHGRKKSHVACANGLGLKRMHQRVEVEDTPANRGMIREIGYMVKYEDA